MLNSAPFLNTSKRGIIWIGRGNFLCCSAFQLGRIKTEKVHTEHTADLEEQRGVDAVAMEDVVDIAAVTVDLAAQPGDGAFLAAEFSLDI